MSHLRSPIAVVAISSLAIVVVGLFFLFKGHQEGGNSNSVAQTPGTIRLAEVCFQCNLVGGTEERSTVIDIAHRTSRDRVVGAGAASVDSTHNRYVAPSGSQEAVVADDGKSLYRVIFSTGQATKLYTAPSGQGIGSVFWANFEDSLVFNQGPISGDPFAEVDGRDVMSYDLATGTSNMLVKSSQFARTVTTVNVIAASTDLHKIVVAYNANGFHTAVWTTTTSTLTQLNIDTTITPFYIAPGAKDSEIDSRFTGAIGWIQGSDLHVMQLQDLKNNTYSLNGLVTTQGGPAITRPSVSGHWIAYIRNDAVAENKNLVLHDLVSDDERVLTSSTDLNPELIRSALWVPDESKIVWPRVWNNGLPTYQAIPIDPGYMWAGPKVIEDALVPEGFVYEGLFYSQ